MCCWVQNISRNSDINSVRIKLTNSAGLPQYLNTILLNPEMNQTKPEPASKNTVSGHFTSIQTAIISCLMTLLAKTSYREVDT